MLLGLFGAKGATQHDTAMTGLEGLEVVKLKVHDGQVGDHEFISGDADSAAKFAKLKTNIVKNDSMIETQDGSYQPVSTISGKHALLKAQIQIENPGTTAEQADVAARHALGMKGGFNPPTQAFTKPVKMADDTPTTKPNPGPAMHGTKVPQTKPSPETVQHAKAAKGGFKGKPNMTKGQPHKGNGGNNGGNNYRGGPRN